MYYVGMDVHWKTSTICILSSTGQKVKELTIRGSWHKLLDTLRTLPQLRGRFVICYEASCGYGHLYDQLRRVAHRVVVAHPGQLRLIFRSKRKNDRIDAQRLAKLLYLDEVPTVHVPDHSVREWRACIEYRRRLVDKRTRAKNGLRSLLRSYGVIQPKGLWTRKGLVWLAAVELSSPLARVRRDMLLEELAGFDRQVKQVTRCLDEIARPNAGITLLQTIPGIGPRTAEAVVAYIDDPHRFGRVRQIGSYFGLVPCQDASARVNRLGHITKDGPATARKLLVEATWQVIRHCPGTRAYYDRLVGGKRDRRKIALVGTAHHLLRCMLSMLQSGEVWRKAA